MVYLTVWSLYWSIAVLCLCCLFSAFLVWCFLPSTQGARVIYHQVVQPLLTKYEGEIDRTAATVAKNVKKMSQDFGKIWVNELWWFRFLLLLLHVNIVLGLLYVWFLRFLGEDIEGTIGSSKAKLANDGRQEMISFWCDQLERNLHQLILNVVDICFCLFVMCSY